MTESLRSARTELEDKVKQRTKKLQESNEALEKFNRVAVGREIKMIELKKKIKELEIQLKGKS